MKKVQVAIVGVGAIAESTHLHYLKGMDTVEVIGLVDTDLQRVEAVAEKHGIPNWFESIEALLENIAVEAVFICTPNATHIGIAKKAAEKGIHVFIEKPIGIDIDEVTEYSNLAKANNVLTMVGMTHRFRRDATILKSYLERGSLGNVYYAKAKLFRRRGTPKGWFTNKELAGGGALMDIGVHVLDLAWWLLGQPEVQSVSATSVSMLGNYQTKYTSAWESKNNKLNAQHVFDVDDFTAGWIRFRNGTVLNLEIAWAINGEEDDSISLEFYGNEGGAKLSPVTIFKEDNGIFTKIEPEFENNDVYQDEINHFIECVIRNEKPLIDADQGLEILKMLQALYTSSNQQKEIILD
ncbi:Gfo/Idh/MocA family protein [Ornithinibacillus scapharcae]|uniref:Gfo/Idh/MocA family protein n=1 Tax=Ornithinibacillus scapharcae TaxID=1147159 RepID=UPI000225BB63|nr:Gfo/Idh/MocA family oxidoreductase [Ornithinibacillus scapharcae]